MTLSGLRLPAIAPRWRRAMLIGGGLAVFFWLRLEDHGVATAVAMGLITTALAGVVWAWPRLAGRTWRTGTLLLALGLSGAGAGALTALTTAGLMLLKNGFHGHLNPDYPAGLLLDTLSRAPGWALAGALLGLGAALLALARAR